MITYGFYVIIHLAIAIAILMLITQMMGSETMGRNGDHKILCNTAVGLILGSGRDVLRCSQGDGGGGSAWV